MLLRDRLPRLPVHVAIDDGLGDREPLQLLREIGLGEDYLCFNQNRRASSGCEAMLAA